MKYNDSTYYFNYYSANISTGTLGYSRTYLKLYIYGYDSSLAAGIKPYIGFGITYPNGVTTPQTGIFYMSKHSISANIYINGQPVQIVGDGYINITQLTSDNVQGTYNFNTVRGEFNVPIQ